MSHHPSSAELAAFRRSLAESADEVDGLHPADAGATGDERRDGIGWRLGPNLYRWGGKDRPRVPLWIPPFGRHEASAMRSRAYAAEAPGWLDPMEFPELPE